MPSNSNTEENKSASSDHESSDSDDAVTQPTIPTTDMKGVNVSVSAAGAAAGARLFSQKVRVDARSSGDEPAEIENVGNATQSLINLNCNIV